MIKDFERDEFVGTIVVLGGSITRAAGMMGVTVGSARRGLRRWIDRATHPENVVGDLPHWGSGTERYAIKNIREHRAFWRAQIDDGSILSAFMALMMSNIGWFEHDLSMRDEREKTLHQTIARQRDELSASDARYWDFVESVGARKRRDVALFASSISEIVEAYDELDNLAGRRPVSGPALNALAKLERALGRARAEASLPRSNLE